MHPVACRYADEPAVLAWELANEPHTPARWESDRGVAPGSTVTAWLDEMSRFLRSLGIRQLIASGEEGYRHFFSSTQARFRARLYAAWPVVQRRREMIVYLKNWSPSHLLAPSIMSVRHGRATI